MTIERLALAMVAARDGSSASIRPELVELTSALHGLAHYAVLCAQGIADAPA